MLDAENGTDLNGFGCPHPFLVQEHSAKLPITEVIVLIAGPSSLTPLMLEKIEKALVGPCGCQVGPLRLVWAPSSCHVAFGTLHEIAPVQCETFLESSDPL